MTGGTARYVYVKVVASFKAATTTRGRNVFTNVPFDEDLPSHKPGFQTKIEGVVSKVRLNSLRVPKTGKECLGLRGPLCPLLP